MVVFLDKLPPPGEVGAAWLAKVRADARMSGETKALAIANELARYVRECGSGEMPSPGDLGKPAKLSEDDAIEAVNALVVRGFVGLVYRPRIRFATLFFCRPGPWTANALEKTTARK